MGRAVMCVHTIHEQMINKANKASKVREQGLVQNKFSVGKPTAMGWPTENILYF